MGRSIRSLVIGLLKASHFGPTVLVVTITFGVSLTQLPLQNSAEIALAIFFGQLVVGWTNDLVDFPRDKAASRLSKPLVAGTITAKTLKLCLVLALLGALVISLGSPLGTHGTALHFLGLLSATAYNLKLKATIYSVLPYIISFSILPWAIYSAADTHPPTWLVLAFMLLASAFHFLNVLKDLDEDRTQDVMGLPQLLGRQKSIIVALTLLIAGLIDVALGHLRF
jgi:4-hydroxybenzoate polyprenyltransferase